MKTLAGGLLLLMVGGCASAPTVTATKPDMSGFQRDNFECIQMTREYVVGPLIALPFMHAAATDRAQANFVRCMKARGYTVTDNKE